MPKLEVPCDGCGKILSRYPSEIGRKGGSTYCSLSCTATTANLPRRSKEFVMDCRCGKRFKTTTHNKAKRHCSRSCASRFSMSEERRKAQAQGGLDNVKNLMSVAEALKRREAWKYAALEKHLAGRRHEFEFELEGRVFDLALLDERVLVEFDGPEHRSDVGVSDDVEKDRVAEAAGYVVVRRSVVPSTVISPETIVGL